MFCVCFCYFKEWDIFLKWGFGFFIIVGMCFRSNFVYYEKSNWLISIKEYESLVDFYFESEDKILFLGFFFWGSFFMKWKKR